MDQAIGIIGEAVLVLTGLVLMVLLVFPLPNRREGNTAARVRAEATAPA